MKLRILTSAIVCVIGAAAVSTAGDDPSALVTCNKATTICITTPPGVPINVNGTALPAVPVPTTSTTAVPTTTTVKATTTTAAATTTTAAATTTSTTMVMPPTTTTTTTPGTTTTTAPPVDPSGVFSEHFDTPAAMSRFDFYAYYREIDAPDFQQTWSGDHALSGAPCSADPVMTKHTIHRNAPMEISYYCNQHLMTSLGDTAEYGQAGFIPRQTFPTISSVCWSATITDYAPAQIRIWWQVSVMTADHNPVIGLAGSPFNGNDTAAFFYNSNIRQPGPFNASHLDANVATASWSGPNFDRGGLLVNNTAMGPAGSPLNEKIQAPPLNGVPDVKTRYPACFTDDHKGHLTFEIKSPTTGEVLAHAQQPGAFPKGPLKVVFSDERYHFTKDGTPPSNTTHWDDIVITP